MRRKNRNKKQVKFVVSLIICLLLVMASGYAAFSTNLTLTAKGNIKSIISAEKLKENVVTTGDGLYKDIYEEGQYVYRGGNPNNYLKLGNDLWRIVSIENDNKLKVVRSELIGMHAYDERTSETTGPRYNDKNTFCKNIYDGQYYGCNIWSKIEGTISAGVAKGTVTMDASLNTYLNTAYYNQLSTEIQNKIVVSEFDIGFVKSTSINENINFEKSLRWNGKIALVNLTDFMKASTDSECTTYKAACSAGAPTPCRNQNYMFHEISQLFLNPTGHSHAVSTVYGTGQFCSNGASLTFGIYPSMFLKSDIKLAGSGTEPDPYIIK